MYKNQPYSADDRAQLWGYVTGSYNDDVYIAALLALFENDRDTVDYVLENRTALHPAAMALAIPIMGCSEYGACYAALIADLQACEDDQDAYLIQQVLLETHYAVLPLIVASLITDSELAQWRLREVLRAFGFDRVAAYIGLLPAIPFESIFVDLFGATAIQGIKQR